MIIIMYSDGESIKSVIVFETDRNHCLTQLQDEGYLIVKEDRVPAGADCADYYPQLDGDERR